MLLIFNSNNVTSSAVCSIIPPSGLELVFLRNLLSLPLLFQLKRMPPKSKHGQMNGMKKMPVSRKTVLKQTALLFHQHRLTRFSTEFVIQFYKTRENIYSICANLRIYIYVMTKQVKGMHRSKLWPDANMYASYYTTPHFLGIFTDQKQKQNVSTLLEISYCCHTYSYSTWSLTLFIAINEQNNFGIIVRITKKSRSLRIDPCVLVQTSIVLKPKIMLNHLKMLFTPL